MITVSHSGSSIPQNQFWNDPARYRAFIGGRGSGKTRAGIIEAIRQPAGTIGMIGAPTYQMLTDAVIRPFLEITRKAGILQSWNITTKTAQLMGDRTILFRSGSDPDKWRGPNLSWIWLDEAALLKPEIWDLLIPTVRKYPEKVWITTTPRGFDWIYHLFHSGDADYSMTQSKSADNPYLSRAMLSSMQRRYTREMYEQEANGEFVDLSGALFRRSWFTVIDSAPPGLSWYRYWDLATSVKTSADYTGSVRVAMDDNTGILYIADGIRIKSEWPDARKVLIQTMRAEHYDTVQGIEEALHGLAAVQELQRLPEIAHVSLTGYRVREDKLQRASTWAPKAEQGLIRIVSGEWVNQFIDECSVFPHGEHDDMVDAVSGAVQMIGQGAVLYDFM